jgi:membrane protein DedA with SNARE-associated domain
MLRSVQPGIMNDLLFKIAQYGYGGLFAALILGIIGLPIPDETILVFCGYLAAKGDMRLLFTWLTALAGSTGGITLSYWVGRSAGHEVIRRYGRYIHFTEDRLAQVLHWFDRMGRWLLTIGYYIPGVRHFTALVAGMSGLPYRSFALYAYPGALLWVSTFIGLGYILKERWEAVFHVIHRNITVAVILVVVIGLAVWLLRTRRKP